MLIGSDGLEYENLTARLLGKPADTFRNRQIGIAQRSGYDAAQIRAFIATYDAHAAKKSHGDHRHYDVVARAYTAAVATARRSGSDRAGAAHPRPKAAAAVRAAHQPALPGGMGA